MYSRPFIQNVNEWHSGFHVKFYLILPIRGQLNNEQQRETPLHWIITPGCREPMVMSSSNAWYAVLWPYQHLYNALALASHCHYLGLNAKVHLSKPALLQSSVDNVWQDKMRRGWGVHLLPVPCHLERKEGKTSWPKFRGVNALRVRAVKRWLPPVGH